MLAWAREPWACIVFNLGTEPTADGLQRSDAMHRTLINIALMRSGTYNPAYHRSAWLDQVLSAHPRFLEFLTAKRHADPRGVFQSDWYRYYSGLLGELSG